MRLAWPRTISTGRRAWSSLHAARPEAISSAAAWSSACAALADLARAARASASPRVMPDKRALTKLATSLSAAGAGSRVERDDAILDAAVGADQHGQRAARVERHEIQLLEADFLLRRHHHPGAGRQARQRRRGRRQRLLDRLVAVDLRLDRRPLARVGQRGLHDPVDEQPEPGLGRHPPGRGVRMGQQPALLQFLHHAADRRRRQADACRPAPSSRPAGRARDRPRRPARRSSACGR